MILFLTVGADTDQPVFLFEIFYLLWRNSKISILSQTRNV